MKALDTVNVVPGRRRSGAGSGSGSAPTDRPPAADARAGANAAARIRLSQKERFALLEQFATLIDSGIQIASALQAMRRQNPDPKVDAVLDGLEQGVVAGLPLSAAMGALPRAFPPLLVQMVRAGEATGQLADMLNRTVETMEVEATMRAKLRSAMLYPGIMLALTIGVVVFLLTYIVPKFERLFRGKQLPTPTRILLALGDGARTHGPWILLGLAVLVVGGVLFLRTVRGARSLDGFLLRMPVVKGIYRTAALLRSIRTLGLLLQSGVPLHAALEHTREVAASPAYDALWRRAHDHVVNGGSLVEAVSGNALLGPNLEQLVAAGEATATLDRVLLKATHQCGKELERKIRDLLTLIEPMMVIVMGAVVGFVALSIMLPIFQMSRG